MNYPTSDERYALAAEIEAKIPEWERAAFEKIKDLVGKENDGPAE